VVIEFGFGTMAKSLEKKRAVKAQLVVKYKNLAKIAGSEPKRRTWEYHALRFQHQVDVIDQSMKFNGQ
jgi:hypothetical protein